MFDTARLRRFDTLAVSTELDGNYNMVMQDTTGDGKFSAFFQGSGQTTVRTKKTKTYVEKYIGGDFEEPKTNLARKNIGKEKGG